MISKAKNLNPILRVSLFNSILRMLQVSISFFLAIYFVEIGLSGTQIGVIFAVNTITSILTILPSGFSSDTFKSKQLITFSLLLIASQFLILSISTNFLIITLISFVSGLGQSIYGTASQSLFYKSTSQEGISKEIATWHGLRYFAIGIGMIIAGQLLEMEIQFKTMFTVIAILIALLTVISHLILPDNRTTEFKILHYKEDILRKKVLFFMGIMFLFSIHFGAESTSYALFLKNNLKLNPQGIGLYMGTAVITMGLATILISKEFHKWKSTKVLLAGLFLSGTFHIIMAIVPTNISFISRVIHEIGDASWFFFLFYGLTKLFDLRRIGGNAGIFTFIATIGSTLGALAFGPMGEIYGYHIPLIVSGATTLIAFIMAIQFTHLLEHE